VNVVAPQPVQNSEFTRVLAGVLHRPAVFPAPAFVLRLALGQMADALLLSSQRVQPEKLAKIGYKFRYETLQSALQAILAIS
jgi:NAD dependent epimerase/dehydratase family enzyme